MFRDKLRLATDSVVSQRQDELVDIPRNQLLGGVVIQSIDFSKEQPLRYRGGLFVVHEDAESPLETVQTKYLRGGRRNSAAPSYCTRWCGWLHTLGGGSGGRNRAR